MLRLQHGMPLADAMRLEPLIPSIAIQLITVGEEAALLDRQFDKLHRLMKSNIERHLRLLVGMVGPVMLALSAGFILLLFFGMFLPMYQNISALSLPR
jgi:type IV pilus assembly protein PilC